MKCSKKVIGELEKCYSLAKLRYHDKDHFLVAAEKINQCRLYDLAGNFEEVIWEEPGGVMTMVQVPGSDGQFLATQKFYSPNDSAEASIIIAQPDEQGGWAVRKLVDLPFVHRFDILMHNDVRYLIACTLKSGHQYKNDWSSPGCVYAAILPEDLSPFNEDNQLQMKVLKDGMPKNHGYYRHTAGEIESGIVSCEQGIYQFTPPMTKDEKWQIEELVNTPASDAVLMDIDQDGSEELLTIEPFHGDVIAIYKKEDGRYKKCYEYEEKLEFLHAMFGGELCGKPRFVVGHRNGERKLLSVTADGQGGFEAQELDVGSGAANVLHYCYQDKDILIATNREVDEIAMYTLE